MKPLKDWHTSDGTLITDGLRVFVNDCTWGTVSFSATLGITSEHFNGWFDVANDHGVIGMYNGERMTTRPHHSLTAQENASSVILLYRGGQYRIHSADCSDVVRDVGNGWTARPPSGGTLLEIARDELSDFMAEDPSFYTDEVVLGILTVESRILRCAQAHFRTTVNDRSENGS